MRELIIPNLNKINLLKDHIITENIDKIENNSFKLVDHTYTIFEEERKIYINCNLQINSKYQKL